MSSTSPPWRGPRGNHSSRSLKEAFVAPFLRRSNSATSLPLPVPGQRLSTPPPLPSSDLINEDDQILHIVRKRTVDSPLNTSTNTSARSASQGHRWPESPKADLPRATLLHPSPRPPRTPSLSLRPPPPRTPSPSPPRRRRPSPLQSLLPSSRDSSYIDLSSEDSDDSSTPSDDEDEDDFSAHPSRVASALLLFPLPPARAPLVASPRSGVLRLPSVLPAACGEGLGLGPALELLEGNLSRRRRRFGEDEWERNQKADDQDDSPLITPPLSPTLHTTHPTNFRLSSSSSGSSSSPNTPSTSPFLSINNSPELVGVPENEMEDDFTRRLRALEHRKKERRDSWAAPKLTPEQRLRKRRSVDALFWRCSLDE